MDVLGVEFQEGDKWRSLRAKRRRDRAAAEKRLAEIAERHARLQRKGIHPLSELDIRPREHSPPPATFRLHEPKVGRNDSCPCGSGKKYKKCCGRG